MTELIAAIILIISFVGIIVILFWKIPALINLPIQKKESFQESLFSILNNVIEKSFPSKSLSLDSFLHKLLSRIRVLMLKTDNKTTNWLQKLRTKSQKRDEIQNDKYWEEIKNSTDNEDKPRLG